MLIVPKGFLMNFLNFSFDFFDLLDIFAAINHLKLI